MSKIGEMDNQGFRALFNYRVDDAKSKYRAPVKEKDREEKVKKLKAKIISDVKEDFLKAIPKVINPCEECIISSNWIKITGPGIISYIRDVGFRVDELEFFFADIAEELTDILGKAVQVDTLEYGFPGNRRFLVKV